ncbi:hypothetical protein CesoFtcFv8_000274 [Champsocephalus esox]|uniref:Uncharacterized protein n=1 Tax=Champsocephalus esox TaxID=159716 RepID=A0AAN8DVE0_9TELE|nr:hypothetical protein CesoFtcFv8_000274 [Champsocephalus esox]
MGLAIQPAETTQPTGGPSQSTGRPNPPRTRLTHGDDDPNPTPTTTPITGNERPNPHGTMPTNPRTIHNPRKTPIPSNPTLETKRPIPTRTQPTTDDPTHGDDHPIHGREPTHHTGRTIGTSPTHGMTQAPTDHRQLPRAGPSNPRGTTQPLRRPNPRTIIQPTGKKKKTKKIKKTGVTIQHHGKTNPPRGRTDPTHGTIHTHGTTQLTGRPNPRDDDRN